VTLQFISQSLSFDMQARVFHHLLRLPLEWFHKRHVGDIQSRFSAIQPIQAFISNGAIAGLLDGVLALLVLVLMFVYSVTLALIVLGSVLAYLVIRLASIQLQRRLAGDMIVTQAFEQTRFLEAVRAIETVKASGTEVMKEGQQRNAIAASINAMIRSGNLQLACNGIAALIDGLTDILVVYLGALAVIRADMTIGMLTAFMAYKMQFGTRITHLVEQFITWRMLTVDLERLSDIALSPADPAIGRGGYDGEIEGLIECRALTFSYAFGEAPVLRGIDLKVEAGEYVAIVGPSGCGKSTLVKLLVGLYRPGSGNVLVDGRPLPHWNTRALREQIAVVTQDDNLMAGSVAENIALFDEAIDMERVKECARAAQIEADVLAMPMGYETLVGDLGSSLSGGQKQRVMIARALYRRPRILILDEGTSHLDLENERAINDALGSLKITRIVVAHRIETIQAASRCIRLIGGRVVRELPAFPLPVVPA
jgi:ATP-binding cassette, subfamily B, bacterial CvaB/MchF/RaxB